MPSPQLEYLHEIRSAELVRAIEYFPPVERDIRPKVLEIGAGTGHQALQLSNLGYDVTAIDLHSSSYRGNRVFPVTDYDGARIPAGDRYFDVVFTSNVLEHVRHIDRLMKEIHRVTSVDGLGIHILPTPTWRLWTAATHYVWLLKRIVTKLLGAGITPDSPSIPGGTLRHGVLSDLFPSRHGERGTVFSESYYFSIRFWKKKFDAGFRVERILPAGLFYTGSLALGRRLPVRARRRLAVMFGSACRVYVVRSRFAPQWQGDGVVRHCE